MVKTNYVLGHVESKSSTIGLNEHPSPTKHPTELYEFALIYFELVIDAVVLEPLT